MQAKRVPGELSDPGSKAWGEVPCERVSLAAVPVTSQPSRYIRTAWADRPYGVVREMRARAAHDGERVYVLVEWESPTRQAAEAAGPDAFPDSVAVMFPANGAAPLETMGAEDAPVSLWRWAAAVPDTVESLVAAGIGSVHPAGEGTGLLARSAGRERTWSVVFSRPLKAAGGDHQPAFEPGASTRVAFAVWSGANQERAGTKAASPGWIELELET